MSLDSKNPQSIEELKANQACIAEIDEILDPLHDRLISMGLCADREGLIKYFQLDSDDHDVLREALKKMWERVGNLQNVVTNLKAKNGDKKEIFELEMEIAEIGRLRIETTRRLSEPKKK